MNSSNLVTPDKRKGQVMIEQGDDQLMHFKWKDRTTGKCLEYELKFDLYHNHKYFTFNLKPFIHFNLVLSL